MGHEIEKVKGWYHPILKKQEAIDHERSWADGNYVFDNPHGWVTYFKFFAWASDFDVVLFADADMHFETNPESMVYAAARDGTQFLTCPEKDRRAYRGFNTHAMILRPSRKTLEGLAGRASTG